MRWSLRTCVAGLVAGCVLASGAGAAMAQTTDGRIVGVEPGEGTIQLVFEAPDLPEDVGIEPGSVIVTVDDQRADVKVEGLGGQLSRRVLLAVDISGSMDGDPLADAKEAAKVFLRDVPNDVEVGLISFDDEASLVVSPTRDRAEVADAVDGLKVGGDTALYDAIGLAVENLSQGDVRHIVVLSDGRDTESSATLEETVAAVSDSGATLDAIVFLDTNADDATEVKKALDQLSAAGRGRVVEARDADDLTKIFAASAAVIEKQILVTATLPEGTASGQVSVRVEARAGGLGLEDTTTAIVEVPVPPAPSPTAAPPRAAPPYESPIDAELMLQIAALLLFTAILIAVGYVINSVSRGRREAQFRRRFAAYTLTRRHTPTVPQPVQQRPTVLGESAVARSALELASRVVSRRGWDERIQNTLVAAGLPFRAAEWAVLHALAAVVPALLLLVLSGGDWLIPILGFILGATIPAVVLSHRRSGRRRRFDEHLPETLQLIAGSLAAGHSLPQAVETAAREAPDPVGGEFNRALVEMRLGLPMEDALQHLAERSDSKDFGWVVMAIKIHRAAGGNLAELLTTVAETLRERERLRRQVLVLSAEGRLSALILGVLPLLFAIYLLVVRRSYIAVLFTDPLGVAMLLGAVIALVIGIVWMRRIVQVEV